MRTLRYFLYFLGVLIIAACGGTGGAGIDLGPKGVAFSSENPQIVAPGQAVDLLVLVRAAASNEMNSTVTVNASATGGTLPETTWDQPVTSMTGASYHALRLNVPANATPGSTITVRVFRTVELIAGHPTVHEDTITLTVGANAIQASLAPATVSGQAGQTVTSTLTITPLGGSTGQLNLSSLVNGVTLNPTSVNLASGPSNVTVSYTIPAGATVGSTIDLPVVYQGTAGHGGVVLHAVVASAQPTPDFEIALDRSTINITPGESFSSVGVTITPTNGFTGDVTITVQFPHASLSVASPNTNPFTITVPAAQAATGSFKINWNNQQGGNPTGDVVVTATRGTISHSATVRAVAS